MDCVLPISHLMLLQLFVLPYKGDFCCSRNTSPSLISFDPPPPSQEGDWVGPVCSERSSCLSRGTQVASGEMWLDPGLLSPACGSRCLPSWLKDPCT